MNIGVSKYTYMLQLQCFCSNEIHIFWISSQDEPQLQEGTFVYASDGGPIDYTYWADGKPNNSGDEDCGWKFNIP